MVTYSTGLFDIALLSPHGKIFEGRAGSVILPAYDGSLGIMRNHCPLMCRLGLGIMHVKQRPSGEDDTYYLIDGGFARMTENNLAVLAYDVTTFEGLKDEEIAELVSDAKQLFYGQQYILEHTPRADYDKAALIVKMAKLASIETTE
jgi:F-type H+-transporting ATPase subunit epsilon